MVTPSNIDFVITWVDGSDLAWRKERAQFNDAGNGNDDSEERYRDWELLHYWFRGVEKFAPWVRKIHFITWGHLPDWMETEHPKLHIVRHEDYIPKEYLPTFNCNVLEIYLNQIEDLSEQFVYFNDDIFLTAPVSSEYFFRNGIPCDMLAFQPVVANPKNPVMSHLYLNNTLTLSKYFKKRENVCNHPGNYFHIGYPPLYFFYNLLELLFPLYTGFYTVHGPIPFCKATFSEVWEREQEQLRKVSEHRFRNATDVTDYLFREWQKLSGNFIPRNIHRGFRYFNIAENNASLLRTIEKQRAKIVCLNDAPIASYDRVKKEIQEAFEKILPEESAFEHRA